jgi:hypothetical protein
MNLSTGPTKLSGALKKAMIAWEQTEQEWRDSVRDQFEAKYLRPLEDELKNTVREMGTLAEVFAKAERDCS